MRNQINLCNNAPLGSDIFWLLVESSHVDLSDGIWESAMYGGKHDVSWVLLSFVPCTARGLGRNHFWMFTGVREIRFLSHDLPFKACHCLWCFKSIHGDIHIMFPWWCTWKQLIWNLNPLTSVKCLAPILSFVPFFLYLLSFSLRC